MNYDKNNIIIGDINVIFDDSLDVWRENLSVKNITTALEKEILMIKFIFLLGKIKKLKKLHTNLELKMY